MDAGLSQFSLNCSHPLRGCRSDFMNPMTWQRLNSFCMRTVLTALNLPFCRGKKPERGQENLQRWEGQNRTGEVFWDHGTSFFAFQERSDLCQDAMQRGLASQSEIGFAKAEIGLWNKLGNHRTDKACTFVKHQKVLLKIDYRKRGRGAEDTETTWIKTTKKSRHKWRLHGYKITRTAPAFTISY